MSFRTRLSVTALEARDNPSGPDVIDPYTPPATDPVATAPPTDTTVTDIATAIATGTTSTSTDPNALNDTNGVTGTPMIP